MVGLCVGLLATVSYHVSASGRARSSKTCWIIFQIVAFVFRETFRSPTHNPRLFRGRRPALCSMSNFTHRACWGRDISLRAEIFGSTTIRQNSNDFGQHVPSRCGPPYLRPSKVSIVVCVRVTRSRTAHLGHPVRWETNDEDSMSKFAISGSTSRTPLAGCGCLLRNPGPRTAGLSSRPRLRVT